MTKYAIIKFTMYDSYWVKSHDIRFAIIADSFPKYKLYEMLDNLGFLLTITSDSNDIIIYETD